MSTLKVSSDIPQRKNYDELSCDEMTDLMNRDLPRVVREIAPELDISHCEGDSVYKMKCPATRSEWIDEYVKAIRALRDQVLRELSFTQICVKTNGTEVFHVVK